LSASTLGILLAGGQGRRLELGRPKALVTLAGETLLERACATLARASDEVLVVAPAELALPLPAGTRRLLDPGLGPLGGIAVAAAALDSRRALVLGVDFPLVRPETLVALVDRLGLSRAVVPAPGGRAQPLVAAYAREALSALAGAFARGERSVTRAVEGLDPVLLGDSELETLPGGSDCFFDVDTQEALARAEGILLGGEASVRRAPPGRQGE
jgi:molybdopterin-guanine dinucleotide biosynthesis protein A